MASKARVVSNEWIERQAHGIKGRVLSVGSGDDGDWQGRRYRQYFTEADSYETSDIAVRIRTDLRLDVRNMPEVGDGAYDCVFCAGVLEHIDDMFSAMSEMSRVLKVGGILLLGVPFCWRIHRPPQDYWRITIHGLRYLIERYGLELQESIEIPGETKGFPMLYWSRSVKAR